jgi:hypothetical protein
MQIYLNVQSPTATDTADFIEDLTNMISAVKGDRSIVGKCVTAQLIYFVARNGKPEKAARMFLHFCNLYTPLGESLQADLTQTDNEIFESLFVGRSSIENIVISVKSIRKEAGNNEDVIVDRLGKLLPPPDIHIGLIAKEVHCLALLYEGKKIELEKYHLELKQVLDTLSYIAADGVQGCQ